MAYKKYIQKNGKLYGPYLYESKRVDGKVISEYHGQGNKLNYKTFLFIFGGAVILAALVLFFILSNKGVTGGVVLGLDASYEAGKPLEGKLEFSLKEGEFLPSSSKVVFQNSGKEYAFYLNEIINEETSEGNYYISDKNLQGNGTGYGIEGEKTIYPEIEFTLQIYNEINEEEINESEENPIENETIPEEPVQEEIPVESISEETTEETSIESTSEEISSTPITGNVIRSGGFLTSLFGMTGMVSLELEEEINGIASKEKEFVYELKEGQTAELKPKSVKINGEEREDNLISLRIEEGKVIVTTDYSEIEKGYGQEYLGNKDKKLSFDLSNLNLILEEGDLIVKLIYGEEEIFVLTTFLEDGEEASNETIIPIEEENETEINESAKTNETIEIPVIIPEELNDSNKNFSYESETIMEFVNSSIWEIGDFLSAQEKKILTERLGNISLQSTSSELINGNIIRRYSFGGYSIEKSYNPSLTREILEVEMTKDRVKFLKSIAKSISA